MFVPVAVIVVAAILIIALGTFAVAVVRGRNPLPFPDFGSRIFSTPSPEAKRAITDLMAQHGVPERFAFDTPEVRRSILWDGTIVNTSSPDVLAKLRQASSAIGLVAQDPPQSAQRAVEFLQSRGFRAEIVPDVEPGLPIVFVVTDALSGAALNFRPHVTKMPRPPSVGRTPKDV